MIKKLFVNRYGEPRSWWPVMVALMLYLLGYAVVAALLALDLQDEAWLNSLFNLFAFGVVTTVGMLTFRLIYRRGLRHAGLVRNGCFAGLIHGVGAGAVLMGLVYGALLISGQATVLSVRSDQIWTLAMGANLAGVFAVMFAEEFFVRGFMMTALKTSRSKPVVLLVPVTLFTLYHVPALVGDGADPPETLLTLFNLFAFGLLCAYLFVRSGKLWLPIGFHFAWQFVKICVLGMPPLGDQAVVVSELGGSWLLTGGAQVEGSILVTVVLSLGFVYARCAIKQPSPPAWTMDSTSPT